MRQRLQRGNGQSRWGRRGRAWFSFMAAPRSVWRWNSVTEWFEAALPDGSTGRRSKVAGDPCQEDCKRTLPRKRHAGERRPKEGRQKGVLSHSSGITAFSAAGRRLAVSADRRRVDGPPGRLRSSHQLNALYQFASSSRLSLTGSGSTRTMQKDSAGQRMAGRHAGCRLATAVDRGGIGRAPVWEVTMALARVAPGQPLSFGSGAWLTPTLRSREAPACTKAS